MGKKFHSHNRLDLISQNTISIHTRRRNHLHNHFATEPAQVDRTNIHNNSPTNRCNKQNRHKKPKRNAKRIGPLSAYLTSYLISSKNYYSSPKRCELAELKLSISACAFLIKSFIVSLVDIAAFIASAYASWWAICTSISMFSFVG